MTRDVDRLLDRGEREALAEYDRQQEDGDVTNRKLEATMHGSDGEVVVIDGAWHCTVHGGPMVNLTGPDPAIDGPTPACGMCITPPAPPRVSEGDTIDLLADNAVVRRTYAIAQVIARPLYDDKPAMRGMAEFLIGNHVKRENLTRVDDEHRVAYSFGKLVHANDCGRQWVSDGEVARIVGECSEGCVILPCGEADASLVMMMIEFGIEVDDDA